MNSIDDRVSDGFAPTFCPNGANILDDDCNNNGEDTRQPDTCTPLAAMKNNNSHRRLMNT